MSIALKSFLIVLVMSTLLRLPHITELLPDSDHSLKVKAFWYTICIPIVGDILLAILMIYCLYDWIAEKLRQ